MKQIRYPHHIIHAGLHPMCIRADLGQKFHDQGMKFWDMFKTVAMTKGGATVHYDGSTGDRVFRQYEPGETMPEITLATAPEDDEL